MGWIHERHMKRGGSLNGGEGRMLTLRPVTLAEAKAFVGRHHRHNDPPLGWCFGVGVECAGELAGVAIAGRPVARKLADGRTLEVTRTCTTGARNANSMLYGAIARAAEALGYDRLITYTLESESGASLRAAGWSVDTKVEQNVGGWSTNGHAPTDLFGRERFPLGPRIRWIREIRPRRRARGKR